MSFATERTLIEPYLATNWTTTDIAYPNVAFTPTAGTAFIRLSILNGTSTALEFNPNPRALYTGIIMIGIFVPVDSGTATARSYADTLAGLFEGYTLSNIEFAETAEIIDLGQEKGWYHINLTISFQRYES